MVPLRQPEPEPVDVQENMDPDNPDDLSQTDDENIETVDDGQLSLF